MDGFDAGDFAQKWTNATCSSSTTTRFASGRSIYMANYGGHIQRSFPASSEVFFGAAILYANTTLRDPFGSSYAVSFFGDSGSVRHVSIATNSTGCWIALVGTTQVAASLPILRAGCWDYVEVRAVIADSGGRIVLKVNGASVIDYTGDTKNGGTAASVDMVYLTAISSANTDQYYDDIYLCDATGAAPYNTFLGDVRVQTLIPNGAGASTQSTPSSGANYTTVDELPYSATDYVQSNTSGNRDTYTFSDLSNVGTIYGVQNNFIAKKTDAGSLSLKSAVKSGASVYYGSSAVLATNDATVSDTRSQDPNTSAAWTQSGVNALEAGFEVV